VSPLPPPRLVRSRSQQRSNTDQPGLAERVWGGLRVAPFFVSCTYDGGLREISTRQQGRISTRRRPITGRPANLARDGAFGHVCRLGFAWTLLFRDQCALPTASPGRRDASPDSDERSVDQITHGQPPGLVDSLKSGKGEAAVAESRDLTAPLSGHWCGQRGQVRFRNRWPSRMEVHDRLCSPGKYRRSLLHLGGTRL
jgi:hypothetical protein